MELSSRLHRSRRPIMATITATITGRAASDVAFGDLRRYAPPVPKPATGTGEAAAVERRVAYETARLRLARYRVQGDEARVKAAEHATEVSAEALQMERVGVWLFRGPRLVCISQYIRTTGKHEAGAILPSRTFPTYVAALQEHRIIAAEDAREHPSTRELKTSYLDPLGITSMLDAPIIRNGRVIGVVCHEHIGAPRKFSQKDLEFASSVADMITLIFEQADRLELEAALQAQTEQRLEQQKMEALGRMARAVAHDFNNLLATVSMTITLLARSTPPSLKATIDEVTSMVEVGRRLTQQLMTFGKAKDDKPSGPIDVGATIDRILPMLRSGAGKSIGIRLEVLSPGARAAIDASHLEQIVLNLCLNARDAIDGNGLIVIVVRDALDTDEVPPDHLVLEVRDTGRGMNEATSARIFEPFFTTKSDGTGLGLATVYGIVQRAGGVARVESQPGAGTTMRVSLPRIAQ
jgi:two-component system cell cycle sensor histidine kinase/response regulator CckA